MTFQWDFGNGITSTAQDTSVSFIAAGTSDTVYTVRLIAFSEHGCADTFTSTVRVHPGPVASFGVNQAIACAPFNFEFTNNSINSTNFYWAVDGVYGYNQTTRPDTLISSDTQSVLISLVAETSFGCPNDTADMVIGTSRNPIADFVTNPDSGCGPLTVAFGNTSQFASSFFWDFRNGETSSSQDTSMSFDAALFNDSTYTIKLYAYNWQGCPDSTERDIVVHPNPDVTFTQSNTDSCGPLTVSFTNTSTHYPGGSIADMTFNWTFSNGSSSTAQDTVIQFLADNINDEIYTVQLIGLNRYGCPDTATSTVRVYPNPVAQFTMSQADSCGPMGVSFTNTSFPNDTGTIADMTFSWNLGNGATGSTTHISTSYGASLIQDSVYTIQLIAFSEHGCPDTATNTVRVYPKPTAQYTQSDTSGCGPLVVTFGNTSIPYDTSAIGDMTFQWDFGNGITSTSQDESVSFVAASINDTVYTVRLIAFSEHGCADTVTSTVRVHPKPTVSLTKDDSIGCDPVSVNFTGSGVNVTVFHWDFGDSSTSTLQNPSHDFRAIPFDDTTYLVKLVGESPYGCLSDTITTTVTVLGGPYAEFYPSPDSVCATTSSQMINNSLGATSYLWDFGNGDTSSVVSPQALFLLNPAADTTYHIVMVASNLSGCRDTAEGYVVVSPIPTAAFTLDTDTGCSPHSVQFTDQSLFAISHAWAYSNGQSDTADDPVFSFTNSGIVDSVYLVRLIVTNLSGCTDTATDLVRVYPNPTADFVATPSSGCGDLTVSFSNQSTPNDTGSISIMSFEWDLGNGTNSTAQNPSTSYLRSQIQDSVYTITLIGSSEHGCRDTTSNTVRVFPQPLAQFSQSDTSDCGPLTVSFQNTSIPFDTGSIADMNFQWDFGNGFVGYDRHDTITFYPALVNDTVYTVRLIAFSEHGCRDTAYSTVRVHPTPLVDFSRTPTSGCSPLTVAFTSNTTNITSYFWDFGNGDTSTQANPSAIFNNVLDIDTVFTITLSGESLYGCPSDSATRTVIVRPDPVAAFTQSEDSVCGTTTIVFSNASTGANSYAWNFGDGSTAANTHPQHSFSMNPLADTTYTVRLIASSFHNCRDTVLGSVTIFPFPTAVIETDTSMGCNPLTVNFSHTSLLSTGFAWDFGNGNTSTSQTPSSVFTNNTLYDTLFSVELLVSSVHGCVDSTTTMIRVFPDPTVEFVAQPTSGCGDLTVNFNNQSTPNDTGSIAIMSFNWDLGNGSTSTATHPSSLYLRALTQDSIYTVELIGTSEHGCRDTVSHDVRTFPKPLADFTQSDTSGCGPLTVSFTNISIPYDTGSINDMSFFWDFGNGLGSTNRNESTVYYPSLTQDTVYTVRLIALSEHGCRDTMYSTVRVHPDPNISYTQTPSSGCSPLTVNFNATGLNVQSWHWDFADGDTSTQEDPIEVFLGRPDFDTTYAVTLSAVSAYGCLSDTLTSNVVVRLMPVASFVKSNESICGPTTIFFTNQSTGANAYSWSFGDGGTSGTANPSHAYSMNPTVDTTYIVRLIATNFYNCRDTTFDSVSIFPYPTAVIVTDTSMGCNPLTVNFSHNSLLSTGFAWDFGNGNTSTSQTPSSVFTNSTLYDTLYSVELLVSSVHGCVDSTTRTIRVFPDPTVEFVAQPTSGCGDLTVNFNNQSTPNDTGSIAIMSFNWDLGNGSSSTATHPSSLYLRALTQDSIYTVELIGTSEHGCRDSVSHDVRTFPKPLANFTQSDTSGCGPLTVSFTNISIPYDTGSINDMSFFWDFGNGSGSTNRNESMVFYPSLTQDTVYTIRLIALSEHGCRDTMFSTVRVHPDPNINFTPDLTSGCGPLPVQFSSSVLNVGTYYWDFGDGDTSHQANPLHSFQNRPDLDTSYTVRFWGQSSYGCWSDTVSQVIIVRPDPVANFSQNLDSLCGGGLIQFSNNSTLGYTYQWDFGDGSATTTAVNPQHTFVEVPFTDTQYPVQLIATSVYGCRDTLVKPTTIFPLPDAQITHAPDSGCSPLLVQFGNLSTIAASHSWTFGDNSSAIGDTLQHLFTNPLGIDQDFQVIMQAVTVHGCIDRDTVSIRVHPLPRPNFVFNKTGICDTSEYNFSNLSAGALLYEWDFGDGTGSFQDDPSHIYPTAVSSDTTFVAKLIATTNRGCIDSISTPVTVTPIMLARASTNNASGCPPLEVDFINNSTNATSYYWDFGDGFVSTSATPSHTFINPDQSTRVYTVQLIVNNNFGCADTAEVQITVAPNIDANFIASKTSLCTVAEYDFVNLSVGSVDYQWDFGDGSNSTQSSPTHVFPTSLTQDTSFTVRLVARSSVNCYDTMYRTVTVHPIVTALFTVNNNEACGSMLAQFTNLSRNGNYHVWDFGDGSGTAQFSPSHAYFQIGTYYPSITVYDAYGCSATYTLPNPIIIWQVPQANFIATPTTQRLPAATFDFTNLSVAIDPLTYEWDFGDPGSGANNNSSLQDPQHTYSDSGTYVIRLIVDNGHCRDTIERTVRLEYYFPIASFRQDPDTGCMEHTVNFINESQYATSYRWFFGDGGQSTDENPTHTYVNPGIYTVSLIAYGPGGVDDTTKVDQIVVIQKPYANFYVTPFVAWMPNTTFTFVNTSLLATSYIWDIESPDGNDITTTDENPILDLNVEGEYSIRLIAINDYGCRDTAYRENLVRVNADGVLLVPDAFTPNGDGINDQFRPVFEGVERENYHFRVYNRWGELIFDTRDIDEAWDGTFQGKMCESEVYVWQVEGIYYGKQHFEQNGRVMLLR
ncbi:MAG TPA: hypothetical protein DIW47_10770 [Bacteroidetes bacterium]|nr:hypothetical protein [Bacteroidota bacterium]